MRSAEAPRHDPVRISFLSEEYERPELSGGWLRLAWRGPALAAWCVALWFSWLVVGALTRPLRVAGEPRRDPHKRARFFFFRTWGRGVLALCGVTPEVRGRPPLSALRPTLVVANHVSYLDVALVASYVDCAFIAKSEIARWPFAGWLASAMHTIYVERERKRDVLRVNGLVERALDEGLSVVLFAEGQSTSGRSVLPFRPSLFAVPARLAAGIACACVHYSRSPAAGAASAGRPGARELIGFYGDAGFVEHLVQLLRSKARFRARLTFDEVPLAAADRKALASAAWERVNAHFEPLD